MQRWATLALGWAVLYVLLSTCSACDAADRVALVIGNGKYTGTAALDNPANDADAIEGALQDLGFKVTKKKDLDLEQMQDALVDFRRALPKGSLALFYYAGHGVQLHGENFLVPVGARLREEFEVKRQCLHVDQVLDAMAESDSNLKVVVLDCCRNNPFTRGWKRGVGDHGLAAITNIPDGTLIAFSTAPGKTADDGDGKNGKNSPYAAKLATVLRSHPDEGLELVDAFRESSRQVKRVTGQVPWLNMEGSLEKYYLRPAIDRGTNPKPSAPSPPAKTHVSTWDLPLDDRPADARPMSGKVGASPQKVWFGGSFRSATTRQAKEAKLPRRAGVVVRGIFPGSPLEQAAIVPGDLIVKVGDEWISQTQDMSTSLVGLRAGDHLAIAFARDGERHDTRVTLQSPPSRETVIEMLNELIDQGQVWAQQELGQHYLNGTGVVKDNVQAAAWLRKAAEAGDSCAQALLAELLIARGGPQNDAEALVWSRKSADQQDPWGQLAMGYLFREGRAVPQDFQQAIAWYKKSAYQGNPRALVPIGRLYLEGKGVPQNDGTAAEWFQQAANQGDAEGQNELGALFENGKGVARDPTRALQYYRLAAEQGNVLAKLNLGQAYRDGVLVSKDPQQAVKWLQEAGSQGSAAAYIALAGMYAFATGVPQDYPQAFKYYHEAAKLGSPIGQYSVGLMTFKGWGVKKDYDIAMQWYRKAAAQGYAEAYNDIGVAYQNGWGVPKDEAQAVKYYHEAAKTGMGLAQSNLGQAIMNGQGVQKDYPTAMAWMQKAVKQGIPDAMHNIGVMHEHGWGVAADRATAISWYKRAADLGFAPSKEALRNLAAE